MDNFRRCRLYALDNLVCQVRRRERRGYEFYWSFLRPNLSRMPQHGNDILPAEVHMVAMALISSFASLGGAIFPLIAGAILDAKGDQSLTYVTVSLAAAMACLWTLFPSRVPSRPMLD
ncbi:hypothetical protein BDZ97DRAFT_1250063 [Flammula alnicola]|nr:hypothetical protein BDZ97DRAFT_1250063 [Flammula alnicola]